MTMHPPATQRPPLRSVFQRFEREDWALFRAGAPLSLTDEMLQVHAGLIEPVSVGEVLDIYLPLARLLGLNIAAIRDLHHAVQSGFFGAAASRPYVIGVAGSVAVGKSTFARLLQAVLQSLDERLDVALVATDGFLHNTETLNERHLMQRKGFPESYDLRRMLSFLVALKSGEGHLEVPVYSHHLYNIVPNKFQSIDRPDVVIFEGLNVLQTRAAPVVASDFFDYSIYIDAETTDIEAWYIKRFLLLQETVFQDPTSYFHRFANLQPDEAVDTARHFWREINLPNLVQNIAPTRERASLVLRKQPSHAVGEVWLRKA